MPFSLKWIVGFLSVILLECSTTEDGRWLEITHLVQNLTSSGRPNFPNKIFVYFDAGLTAFFWVELGSIEVIIA